MANKGGGSNQSLQEATGKDYSDRVGSFSINRGAAIISGADKLSLYAWDHVSNCIGKDDCPAGELCPYDKSGTRKCKLMLNYMKSTAEIIYRNLGDDMDEIVAFQVGLQLIPLYKMLCKLKIVEVGVTQDRVIHEIRGAARIHPIFKEVRETIKLITQQWNMMGLNKMGFAESIGPEEFFKEPVNVTPKFKEENKKSKSKIKIKKKK